MLTFNEYVTEATKGPSIKQSVIDAYKKATGGHTSAVYHNKGKDGSSTVKVDEPHLKPEEMKVFHDHLKSIHGDTYIKTENRASKKLFRILNRLTVTRKLLFILRNNTKQQ